MLRLRKKKYTSRTTRRRAPDNISDVIYRKVVKSIVVASCAIAILWMGALIYVSDIVGRTANLAGDIAINLSAKSGFVIDDVLVEGRKNTDPEMLLTLLNVEKGDPIFEFSPEHAQRFIQRVSWVEDVKITRVLPDKIHIQLQERQAAALWRRDGNKVSVVDKQGVVLTSKNWEQFEELPIVVGKNAIDHLDQLLTLLEAEPEIAGKLETARPIGNRRWDLQMSNNIKVKMPATDTALAFGTLSHAQEEDQILDSHQISFIDLRVPDKMIVKAKPGMAAQLQQRNRKKK